MVQRNKIIENYVTVHNFGCYLQQIYKCIAKNITNVVINVLQKKLKDTNKSILIKKLY